MRVLHFNPGLWKLPSHRPCEWALESPILANVCVGGMTGNTEKPTGASGRQRAKQVLFPAGRLYGHTWVTDKRGLRTHEKQPWSGTRGAQPEPRYRRRGGGTCSAGLLAAPAAGGVVGPGARTSRSVPPSKAITPVIADSLQFSLESRRAAGFYN